ncbi:hypothetical protein PW52_09275 [Tamlana sedimentorum]|uniref:Uncharacterized protein n=1 Tax=Neotamlana sedimentorum TaxID=1435349 RepID=A0A0D7WB36_9FLAO|nr:hypothetical protein PW52_09275 [Tamlana sedimentorum]
MKLNEIYFYMILFLFQFFSLIILTCSEDLKDRKHLFNYTKVALFMFSIGCIMEIFNWNYLQNFECIFFTALPLLLIFTIKILAFTFKSIFKKEPFQLYRNELSDGIWVKNRGNFKKHHFYYSIYSLSILLVPILSFTLLYIALFK